MIRKRHVQTHGGGDGGHHHRNHVKKHGSPSRGGAKPNKVAGYGVGKSGAQNIKDFNQELMYVQGFTTTVGPGGQMPITVTLNSPGKWLHGIATIPTLASDISSTTFNLVVNNNNVLTKFAAQNSNPGFTQNNIFFPTPQPLVGTDTITLNITNSGAGSITVTVNFFYVPR